MIEEKKFELVAFNSICYHNVNNIVANYTNRTRRRDNDIIKNEIIRDTGATASMFPDTLYIYKDNMKKRVSFGDNIHGAAIFGYGTTNLTDYALYVPDLSVGIVGVGPYDENGCTMIIRNSKYSIVDKEDNVILTGTRQKRLYYLDKEYLLNWYDNVDESKYYENYI